MATENQQGAYQEDKRLVSIAPVFWHIQNTLSDLLLPLLPVSVSFASAQPPVAQRSLFGGIPFKTKGNLNEKDNST